MTTPDPITPGEKVSAECHEEALEGTLTRYKPELGEGVETRGNSTERRSTEGDAEHRDGHDQLGREAPVSEVRPEIGPPLDQRRDDVRDGVPLGGLRLRADHDPVDPITPERVTPGTCRCDCHKPGLSVKHVAPCCWPEPTATPERVTLTEGVKALLRTHQCVDMARPSENPYRESETP